MDGGLMDGGLMDGGLMDGELMDGGLMDGGLMGGRVIDGLGRRGRRDQRFVGAVGEVVDGDRHAVVA